MNVTTNMSANGTDFAMTPPDSMFVKQSVNYVCGSLTVVLSVLILASTHKIGPRKLASVTFFYQMTTCALLMGLLFLIRGSAETARLSSLGLCKFFLGAMSSCTYAYLTTTMFMNVELYLSVRDMIPGQRSALKGRTVVAMSVLGLSFCVLVNLGLSTYGENDASLADFGSCVIGVSNSPVKTLIGLLLLTGLIGAMFFVSALTIRLITAKMVDSGDQNAPWLQERRQTVYTMVATLVIYTASSLIIVATQFLMSAIGDRQTAKVRDAVFGFCQFLSILPMMINGAVYLARNKNMAAYLNHSRFCRPRSVDNANSSQQSGTRSSEVSQSL